MRSARAISCTCHRIVSVFSNRIVRIGPSATRRVRFSSMMCWRKSVALALVGAEIDDVVDGQLAHVSSTPSLRTITLDPRRDGSPNAGSSGSYLPAIAG